MEIRAREQLFRDPNCRNVSGELFDESDFEGVIPFRTTNFCEFSYGENVQPVHFLVRSL